MAGTIAEARPERKANSVAKPIARLTSPPRLDLRWRAATDDHVIALGWDPDGSTFATASVAGPVKVQAVTDFGEGVSQVAWSPGDGRLAVGGEAGAVGVSSV
jgi:WD40 repeat protein